MVWFLPTLKKAPVFHSKISGEITVRKRYGKLAVLTGEITQSGGEIYPMWKEAIQGLKRKKKELGSCLVLGVGGGTVIDFLHQAYPLVQITGVELDPIMLTIATEFFVLKGKKDIALLQEDALTYAKKNSGKKKFDLIVVDLYVKEFNPQASREEPFLTQLKKMLMAKGIVLYNAHFQGENEHQKLLTRLGKQFKTIETVYSYPLNRVLLLT